MDAEENGEASFTINELAEAELEADLVLGGDDGKECTYQKGYMVRQAIFTCLTCTPEGNAGCCTACSMNCHDGHQVLELWTKRHFRCDCGNSKSGGLECKLCPNKEAENKENSYNQNFVGKYCFCHRPYPDSEGEGEEELGEMLQCCICEDWFHEAHLGLTSDEEVPKDDENDLLFEALICQGCVKRCDFLVHYPELHVAPTVSKDAEGEDVSAPVHGSEKGVETTISLNPQADNHFEQDTGSHPVGPSKCRLVQAAEGDKQILDRKEGKTEGPPNGKDNGLERATLSKDKAIFLCKSWRSQLCQCSECSGMYKSRKLDFLFEQGDSLQEYEEVASQRRAETLAIEEGAQRAFLDKLGHVQQIELLHGINDMTTQLVSFLTPIAETGRSITSDDIYDCFEQLKKKRRKDHNRAG